MNLGAIAGYTLGGVMITYFGWRSIFLINVPIGIFGTIWGYLRLKEIGVRPVGQKFDYAGSILYCIGLIDYSACLDYWKSHFSSQYCHPCQWTGIFHRSYICRVKAEVSDTRPDAFQDKVICGRQFNQFLELSCIQLRPVSEVLVSSTDTGLQCFKSRCLTHPYGNRSPHLSSNKRKTIG